MPELGLEQGHGSAMSTARYGRDAVVVDDDDEEVTVSQALRMNEERACVSHLKKLFICK